MKEGYFIKHLPVRYYIELVNLKNYFFQSAASKKNKEVIKCRAKFYQQFISSNDLCFDIGANYGNRVEAFLQLNAHIIAVEPQQTCVNFLKEKYKNNNVIVVDKGVADIETTLDYYVSEAEMLSSFSKRWIDSVKENRFNDVKWLGVEQKAVTTLERLIADFGKPVFIKIDVEGFELKVLKGLKTPITAISFEYAVPENLTDIIGCIEILTMLANYRFNFSVGESLLMHLPNWVDSKQIIELIGSSDFLATSAGDIYAKIFI